MGSTVLPFQMIRLDYVVQMFFPQKEVSGFFRQNVLQGVLDHPDNLCSRTFDKQPTASGKCSFRDVVEDALQANCAVELRKESNRMQCMVVEYASPPDYPA